MTATVTATFEDQFDSETKLAYQQRGPKLRGCVRIKTDVQGSTHRFNKLGKGKASGKVRHGNVPLMGLQHSNTTAILLDRYAAEMIDELDEFKTSQSLRDDYSMTAAAALGRESDQFIISQWDTTPNTIVHGGLGMTLAKIEQVSELMDSLDIPPEDRWAVISPRQKTEILRLPEATSGDFTKALRRDSGQMGTAEWMGFKWIVHTGLPLTLGAPNFRTTYFVHRQASGLAVGKDMRNSIERVAEKDAWLVMSKMSMGAALIDSDGVFAVQATE